MLNIAVTGVSRQLGRYFRNLWREGGGGVEATYCTGRVVQ
jgi:hypothetical protein